MKQVTKIIWKNEPCTFWCGGSAPDEKNTLTLTRDEIQFVRTAQMNDYLGGECPISEAKESWKIKVKHPDYAQAFATIAEAADKMINAMQVGFVCDGPIQSLIVYYEDGTKAKLLNKCSFLLDEVFLKEQLSSFLPDRMWKTIFGEYEEEEE